MQLNQMFKEFNTTYGIANVEMTIEQLRNSGKLIQDEVDELFEEFFHTETTTDMSTSGSVIPAWTPKTTEELDKPNVVKELTDILYITMQQMTQMGLNIEDCLSEVHNSNMSKRVHIDDLSEELETARLRYPDAYEIQQDQDWFVLRDAKTGKVIKPMCYTAADMKKVM